MKQTLFAAVLTVAAFSAFGQRFNQVFTQLDGTKVVLNVEDIAAVYPRGSGSTLALGPSLHTLDVTESTSNIVATSGGLIQQLTEVVGGFTVTSTRTVLISLQHVFSVKYIGNNTCRIVLRNPILSINVQGSFAQVSAIIAKSVGTAFAGVNTDSTLTGLGTSLDTLRIAQHGATTGQVLAWDGTTWRPADDQTSIGATGHILAANSTGVANRDTADFRNGEITWALNNTSTATRITATIDSVSVAKLRNGIFHSAFTGYAASGSTVNLQYSGGEPGLTIYDDIGAATLYSKNGLAGIQVTSSYSIFGFGSGTGGDLNFSATDLKLYDNRTTKKGLEYDADYSANYSSRSVTDKGYVDSHLASRTVSTSAPSSGQIFKWNGSTWALASDIAADADYGDITVASGVWTIDNTVVTYAKIQDVTGLSVIGRAASTSGVTAAITGTADQVLRVNAAGTSLGFGTITSAGITDATIANADLAAGVGGIYKGSGTIPNSTVNASFAGTSSDFYLGDTGAIGDTLMIRVKRNVLDIGDNVNGTGTTESHIRIQKSDGILMESTNSVVIDGPTMEFFSTAGYASISSRVSGTTLSMQSFSGAQTFGLGDDVVSLQYSNVMALTARPDSANLIIGSSVTNGFHVTDDRATKTGLEYTNYAGLSPAAGSLIHRDYADTHLGTRTLSTSAPSTGYVIKWDGSQWAPAADATGGGGLSDGDYGDITVASGVWTIDNSVVTYAKIQDVTGLSVIGRAGSTSGVTAAITGTADQVLRVNTAGTSLGFGTITSAGITDATIANADLASGVGGIYKGNGTIPANTIATTTSGATGDFEISYNNAVAKTCIFVSNQYGLELLDTSNMASLLLQSAGVYLYNAKGELRFTTSDLTFYDYRAGAAAVGLQYDADYSANYTSRSIMDWGAFTGNVNEYAQDAVGTILVDGTTIDFTYSDATPSITAEVIDASVTYAKIQNVAGLSVVGRSANSSGVSAAITGTDGQVLRVSGTTLGFGTIVGAGIASGAITDVKVTDVGLAKITGGTWASGFTGTITASTTWSHLWSNSTAALILNDATAVGQFGSRDGEQVFEVTNTSANIYSGTSKMTYTDGVLAIFDSDATNKVSIQTPATGSLTSNYTLTLPANDGNAWQDLRTDGSGTLTWSDDGMLNARDFGATGNGVTDDVTTLQAAITASPGKVLYIPSGTYYISSELTVPSNVTIEMAKDAIIDISSWSAAVTAGLTRAINISGSSGSDVSLTADVALGATSITVSSTTGYAAGDVVEVSSTEPLHTGAASHYKGYITIVDSVVSSTVLQLANASYFSIDAVGGSYSATLKKYTCKENITIKGGKIQGAGIAKGQVGVYLNTTRNIRIEGMVIDGAETAGVWESSSLGNLVTGCSITDCTSPGYLGVNYGYGVLIGGATRDLRVEKSYFQNCRHTVSGGGSIPSFNAVIISCSAMDCGRGTESWDCHESTIGFKFIGIADDAGPHGRGGMVIRGTDCTVESCNFNGGHIVLSNTLSITGSTLGRTTLINNIMKNYTDGITTSGSYIANVSILGGTIEGTSAEGIKFSSNASNIKIAGVSFISIGTAAISLSATTNATISDCTITSSQYGIDVASSSSNVNVTNCNITATDNAFRATSSDNNTISNCIINGVVNSAGIYFNQSDYCNVSNCQIAMGSTSFDGIRAWGSSTTANNIKVSNTTVSGSYAYGLYCFSNSDSITAVGNNFSQAVTAPVYAPDATCHEINNNMNTANSVAKFTGTTNAVVEMDAHRLNSRGTAATGLGWGETYYLESTTTNNQPAAAINISATDATHATFTSAIAFQTNNSAGGLADVMRIVGNKVGIGVTSPSAPLTVGNTSTATSGTTNGTTVNITHSPSSNSSAQMRSLNMANTFSASGINFTGTSCAAIWAENRVINAGTISNLFGINTSGFLMGSDAASTGTVTLAVGVHAYGVNSFSNSIAGTITAAKSFLAKNAVKGSLTITGQCGINVEALSGATNQTAVLLGTTTIPSGDYAIYSSGSNVSYFGGKVGIGATTAPTGLLWLAAGSTSVPPIVLTSGTNTSSVIDGAVEYNGTDLEFSVSSTRYVVPKTLTGSATLNFASVAAQTDADLTITVTGAAVGDKVFLGIPNGAMTAGVVYVAWVSATNTVSIRCANYTTGAIDPSSATFNVSVIK